MDVSFHNLGAARCPEATLKARQVIRDFIENPALQESEDLVLKSIEPNLAKHVKKVLVLEDMPLVLFDSEQSPLTDDQRQALLADPMQDEDEVKKATTEYRLWIKRAVQVVG
ncbi:hypothetical protein [Ferrimonas marina]|uniref:Uncharacterized protein n=1 Tax=Ferrimonas marina TaxID=299255 RepID=A0A1M5TWW9_9GAMM|nr:hypothetical protein [Ferrimonas marina]SHH55287.1 hypothetical protein SAMN02745129_2312 [Ferrimonas marina]